MMRTHTSPIGRSGLENAGVDFGSMPSRRRRTGALRIPRRGHPAHVEALALRVIADRVESNEVTERAMSVSFNA